jgi:hypothetical protein
MTMWLKACPRCRGDLYEEPTVGATSLVGRYVSCLQCGYLLAETEERALPSSRPRPTLGRSALRSA